LAFEEGRPNKKKKKKKKMLIFVLKETGALSTAQALADKIYLADAN